jgi:hypothetical protein
MSPHAKPGFVAETPRQEGAQGRVGRSVNDTLSNGEIDNSDVNNPPVGSPKDGRAEKQ